jgi:hypothetical protein
MPGLGFESRILGLVSASRRASSSIFAASSSACRTMVPESFLFILLPAKYAPTAAATAITIPIIISISITSSM